MVGRNEQDNNVLLAYKKAEYMHLEVLDGGSPVTLLIGDQSNDNIRKAAMITARYSSLKDRDEVKVSIMADDGKSAVESVMVTVPPQPDVELVMVR